MRIRRLPAPWCLLLCLVMACGGGAAGPKPVANSEPRAGQAPAAAVALVYLGWEIWIGNDDLTPEADPTRFAGVLKAIEAGLDKADLAHKAPPGSLGVAVTYADREAVRVPMGPIANLTSAALGTQKDYYRTIGSELVRGLTRAVDELEKVSVARKVLVVLSDGNDTDNESARAQITALKNRIRRLGIRSFSIIYKSPLSGDANVLANLGGSVTTVKSADLVTQGIENIFLRAFAPSEE